jgi:hypothetical protein
MESGAPSSVVDMAEQIKWWDVLDAFSPHADVTAVLEMACACRHPDAQWLCSLFPDGVVVSAVTRAGALLSSTAATRQAMLDVLVRLEKANGDPRAGYVAWRLSMERSHPVPPVLWRAAERGYAPALGAAGALLKLYEWAERASELGDRRGMYALGCCFVTGKGCAVDKERAGELIREAARLGCPEAMYDYCNAHFLAFGVLDCERVRLLARAAVWEYGAKLFCDAAVALLRPLSAARASRSCVLLLL